MSDDEVLKQKIVRKALDNRTLLILSVIDLLFGIVSMCLTSIDWQICSLIASLLSFVMILKILVTYRSDLKSNVSTLIISIADIFTGALSVALAVYALKAIVVLVSSLKVTKVAVQTSKAVKLMEATKPIAVKTLPKVGAIFIAFCATNINKKRGKTMAKEKVVKEKKAKKQSAFAIYLKNNPKTICGIVASFIASAMSGAGASCGIVYGNAQIPLWASIIIGVLVFGLLMAILCLGCVSAGWESPVMVALRKTAKALGFGKSVDLVEQAYAEAEAQKANEEAQAIAKAKADHDMYEAEYRREVADGNCLVSLDEFIEQKKAEAEQRQQEQAKLELLNEFRAAVANGAFVGSFDDFCAKR